MRARYCRKPVEVTGHAGLRAQRQVKAEPMLILLLARRDMKLHDRFVDEVRVGEVGLVSDFQEHECCPPVIRALLTSALSS